MKKTSVILLLWSVANVLLWIIDKGLSYYNHIDLFPALSDWEEAIILGVVFVIGIIVIFALEKPELEQKEEDKIETNN